MNARADWVLETLLSACAPAAAEVSYPSAALPASQAAWEYFDRGEQAPPRPDDGGMLDFGDGVQDIIASAFWYLSRWEERPGSPRDRHGRFAATSALADPERPAVDALLQRFQQATGRGRCDRFRVVLTHDIDTPRRWTGPRTVVAAGARMKAAALRGRRSELTSEARGLAALPLADCGGAIRTGRSSASTRSRRHEAGAPPTSSWPAIIIPPTATPPPMAPSAPC